MEERESKKQHRGVKIVIVVALVLLVLILLLRSCGGQPSDLPNVSTPSGNYSVTNEPKERVESSTPEQESDEAHITFSGKTTCEVSSLNPELELNNPEVNFVAMVFTVIDTTSGETIATTDSVKPGEYVYVDLKGYYTETGEYPVTVHIDTYMLETGVQTNGLNQEMTIVVTD